MIRSETAQPVHDTQSWVARQLAYFNMTVFWLLCPIFFAPTSIIVVQWLRRSN